MAYGYDAAEGFNYWLMGFIVFLAVTLGNLFSSWIEAKVAEIQIRQATSEFSQQLSESLMQQQAQLDADAAVRQKAAEQRRARDSYGQKLKRQCDDWTRAYAQTPGYTTRKNRDARCGAYREYVKSGKRSSF